MKPRIELDWSRMLGFDQVEKPRSNADALQAKAGGKSMAPSTIAGRVGAKAGAKPGLKPMTVVPAGLGARLGGKAGIKST